MCGHSVYSHSERGLRSVEKNHRCATPPLLEDYTTEQLLDLRHLCIDIVSENDGMWGKADAFLILRSIDEELTRRQQSRKSA